VCFLLEDFAIPKLGNSYSRKRLDWAEEWEPSSFSSLHF
jgi:hypothetical protein